MTILTSSGQRANRSSTSSSLMSSNFNLCPCRQIDLLQNRWVIIIFEIYSLRIVRREDFSKDQFLCFGQDEDQDVTRNSLVRELGFRYMSVLEFVFSKHDVGTDVGGVLELFKRKSFFKQT